MKGKLFGTLALLLLPTLALAADAGSAAKPDNAKAAGTGGGEGAAAPNTSSKDRKSTRLNSSHLKLSRMPSSA